MTVLLPAIVPVGLIILIGFIAGKTFDAGEPNAFWAGHLYTVTGLITDTCTGQHFLPEAPWV